MSPASHERTLQVAGLAALLLAGCSSTPRLEARRLPEHVVVLPATTPTVGQATPGEFDGTETELRLELDAARISRRVSEALGEYCFARTSLYASPQDGLGEEVDSIERERALVAWAREQEADWVLALDLRYDPEIYRRNSSTFWLTIPLFLIAGPLNWLVPEIRYMADVELGATIYDLGAIVAAEGDLGDPQAEVLSVSARFSGTELDFIDRSSGWGDYGLGLLIPSGFLARETEDARQKVEAQIAKALTVQLVQSLQSRRDVLVRTESIAPIFLQPSEVRLERRGGGLRVRGRVLLPRDHVVQDVRRVRAVAGAEPVEVVPEAAEGSAAGYRAFPFDLQVPTGAGARYLRLECEAGGRDKFARSYTFRIPGAPAGED